MPDYYTQCCFAFDCSRDEINLLAEAVAFCAALYDEDNADVPSAAFLELFPASAADQWAGYRALFDDPDYPDLYVDIKGEQTGDGGWRCIVTSDTGLDAMPLARLIQACCQTTLGVAPIPFEWAQTCSRMRIDAFGGGWCVIFADRIEIGSTGEAVSQALAGHVS